VRDDELELAWKIFTPLLHTLVEHRITPEKYVFGSRGPAGIDAYVKKHGYVRNMDYTW